MLITRCGDASRGRRLVAASLSPACRVEAEPRGLRGLGWPSCGSGLCHHALPCADLTSLSPARWQADSNSWFLFSAGPVAMNISVHHCRSRPCSWVPDLMALVSCAPSRKTGPDQQMSAVPPCARRCSGLRPSLESKAAGQAGWGLRSTWQLWGERDVWRGFCR